MLKQGDQVATVCTGTSCGSYDDAKAAAEFFDKTYGLAITYEKDVAERTSAEARATIFLDHLFNDATKAIWCLRGGEGTADIIPLIHARRSEIAKLKAKPLLGFSDFTPILNYFANEYNWVVYHSPGLRQFHRGSIEQASIHQTMHYLMQSNYFHNLRALKPLNPTAHVDSISGKVMGGNLSLMTISVNDIWQPDLTDKIILLEEVNEKPHKVARSLKYLNRIAFFKNARAVVLAGFDFIGEQQDDVVLLEKSMAKVLRSFADSLSIPVLYCDCVGHGEVNFLLPLNKDITLTVNA